MISRSERRRRDRRIRRAILYTMATLSALSFLCMIGTVGAIERDTVPLLEGTVRSFGYLFIWTGFANLSESFYDYAERRTTHEVYRDAVARASRTGCEKPYSSR